MWYQKCARLLALLAMAALISGATACKSSVQQSSGSSGSSEVTPSCNTELANPTKVKGTSLTVSVCLNVGAQLWVVTPNTYDSAHTDSYLFTDRSPVFTGSGSTQTITITVAAVPGATGVPIFLKSAPGLDCNNYLLHASRVRDGGALRGSVCAGRQRLYYTLHDLRCRRDEHSRSDEEAADQALSVPVVGRQVRFVFGRSIQASAGQPRPAPRPPLKAVSLVFYHQSRKYFLSFI